MKKLYFVYEPEENSGVIVAAENNNEAKMMGCGDICCDYIDSRAHLVKEGKIFYDDIDTKMSGMNIIGKGAIETSKTGVLGWDDFKNFVVSSGRGKLFEYDDDGNEIEKE